MRAKRGSSVIAVVALLAACTSASPSRVREGERLLAQSDWEGARREFVLAQDDPRTTRLDRVRAQVGEARAFLGKGDLVGAKTRLRRLEDTSSDKWYFLGDVALREGDPAEAVRCLEAALERAHGGDTASRLARAMAGEAREPARLIEAATAVATAAQPLAQGLAQAAEVWRGLDAGADAATSLAALDAVADRVGEYPAVRVLRARLLDALGRTDEAAAAWGVGELQPRPTDGFITATTELRARLLLESGNADALERVDPSTAARLRAELARARAERGDLRGALDAWRGVAEADGATSPAWVEVAWLEESLGLPTAGATWARAEAASVGTATPAVRARLALRTARQGDLVGGAARLREGDLEALAGSTRPEEQDEARGALALARAAAALERGASALGDGDLATTRGAARALALLDPGGPAGRALTAAGTAGGDALFAALLGAAPGETGRALDRAALRLALTRGELTRARTIAAERPHALQGEARALVRAVLRGLERGDGPAAAALLELPGLPADARAGLLADARIAAHAPALVVDAQGGLPAALAQGGSGALVAGDGRRLSRVTLAVDRRGVVALLLPMGDGVEVDTAERRAEWLGSRARWTAHAPAGDAGDADEPEAAPGAAETAPRVPVVEVR